MTKITEVLTVLEYDGFTNETIIREMTQEELDQRKADAAQSKKQQVEADAKIAARESALSKLAALGLTQEEIDAL